jgi:hypothetical protein
MSPQNWCDYTISYKEAGDLLMHTALKTGRENHLVFPIIFLYRHYIELVLKEIIVNNWEYLGISKPFPLIHDVNELWKICRENLQEVDKLVDSQYAESEDYEREVIKSYDALGSDICRFAEVDPNSQYFRYPVDSKGNPVIMDIKQLAKLLSELPKLISRISYQLDGISTGIYSIISNEHIS